MSGTPLGAPEVRLVTAAAGDGDAELRRQARATGAAGRCVARSYRHPYALVAWHDGPVGVDIERVARCDEAFADLICTPEERSRCAALTGAERDAYLSDLWCAKEALSKALGDALDYEPSRLESPASWVDGSSGPWRAVRLDAPEGHVAWLCWKLA